VHPRPQGLAVDELHRDEDALRPTAHLVHGDDVRVAEPRHRLRLAHEQIAGAAVVKHFDRDATLELGLSRGVHPAHRARSEQVADHVPAKDVTGREHALVAQHVHDQLATARACIDVGIGRRKAIAAQPALDEPEHGRIVEARHAVSRVTSPP
jgi:hypothetical protein